MTVLASWEVSGILRLKRAWIFVKSSPLASVIPVTMPSIASCEVTTIQEAPPQMVLSSSATLWRFTMSLELRAMNRPTSSTKKLRRKPSFLIWM